MKHILSIYVKNTCRSQMAEAFFNEPFLTRGEAGKKLNYVKG